MEVPATPLQQGQPCAALAPLDASSFLVASGCSVQRWCRQSSGAWHADPQPLLSHADPGVTATNVAVHWGMVFVSYADGSSHTYSMTEKGEPTLVASWPEADDPINGWRVVWAHLVDVKDQVYTIIPMTKEVRLWSRRDTVWTFEHQTECPGVTLCMVSIHDLLFVGCRDGKIRVFDDDLINIRTLDASSEVLSLAAQGPTLYSATRDRRVQRWGGVADTAQPASYEQCGMRLPEPGHAMCVSQERLYVATDKERVWAFALHDPADASVAMATPGFGDDVDRCIVPLKSTLMLHPDGKVNALALVGTELIAGSHAEGVLYVWSTCGPSLEAAAAALEPIGSSRPSLRAIRRQRIQHSPAATGTLAASPTSSPTTSPVTPRRSRGRKARRSGKSATSAPTTRGKRSRTTNTTGAASPRSAAHAADPDAGACDDEDHATPYDGAKDAGKRRRHAANADAVAQSLTPSFDTVAGPTSRSSSSSSAASHVGVRTPSWTPRSPDSRAKLPVPAASGFPCSSDKGPHASPSSAQVPLTHAWHCLVRQPHHTRSPKASPPTLVGLQTPPRSILGHTGISLPPPTSPFSALSHGKEDADASDLAQGPSLHDASPSSYAVMRRMMQHDDEDDLPLSVPAAAADSETYLTNMFLRDPQS